MDYSLRKLACEQLTRQLKPFNHSVVPVDGWLKTVRTVLGMTISQLAKRCGVSKQRIIRVEADEVLKKTTLETLDKIANKMGCKLVYAIVPNKSLLELIDKQAEQKALEKLQSVSHSMALEDQKLTDKNQQDQLKMLKDELIRTNIKAIWE